MMTSITITVITEIFQYFRVSKTTLNYYCKLYTCPTVIVLFGFLHLHDITLLIGLELEQSNSAVHPLILFSIHMRHNLPIITDGMTDCSDSECCSHSSCADHIMCLSSNDPVEVLLRKQPPSVTASFYQRVKFLIEENSVQSYAHMDEYTER